MQNEKKSKGDYKHFVRIASTDIDGGKTILYALTKIKGISHMFANAVLSIAHIDKDKRAGVLSDIEIKKLGEIVTEPDKYDVPVWMLNRRKDYETGDDKHLLTSNLDFTVDNDIKRLKKVKSNRGLRHAWNLPVRGQRTKSNFRHNKGKVMGVKRKK